MFRAEQRGDTGTHDGVIIDQEDSDFLGRGGALGTIPDSHGQMTLDFAPQFPKNLPERSLPQPSLRRNPPRT
jgi:hypothetical protein